MPKIKVRKAGAFVDLGGSSAGAYLDHGDISISAALDSAAELQRVRLVGNAAIALPAGLSTGIIRRLSLLLEQDATGGRVPTIGGTAPSTVVATETASEADGTAVVGKATTTGGKTWVGVGSPNWKVQGGRLHQNNSNGQIAINLGTANQKMSAKKMVYTTGATGFALRSTANLSSFLWVQLHGSSVNVYSVPGYAQLAAFATTLSVGDLFEAEIDASNLLTVKKNGVVIGTVTTAHGAGQTYAGFAINSSGNDEYDDVTWSQGGAAISVVDPYGLGLTPNPAASSKTLIDLISGDGGATWFVDNVARSGLIPSFADLSVITANPQTGTTYSLVLTDAGKVVELNNAATVTVTVPTNAAVAFPIGTVIELWQQGAGQVTVAAAVGVTIRSSEGKLKSYGQYSSLSLRKRATDEWVLVGDLVA